MKKVFAILALLLSCSFLYGKSLTVFKYKEKYGVINEKKEVVILPEYDSIKMSSKGLICKTIQEDFTKYSIFAILYNTIVYNQNKNYKIQSRT